MDLQPCKKWVSGLSGMTQFGSCVSLSYKNLYIENRFCSCVAVGPFVISFLSEQVLVYQYLNVYLYHLTEQISHLTK